MLNKHPIDRRKTAKLIRLAAMVLPVACIVLLLSMTAFAKNTYLINDGGHVKIHTTYATDPEKVLDEAGFTLGTDDTYTTQPGFGMSEITVKRMQTIKICYGGNTLTVCTYQQTVEAMLNRLQIELEEGDLVSETMNTLTYDGMVLTITSTATVEETYTVAIPYETRYCYDATLAEGEQVVLTQGVEGQILCRDSVYYVDGQEAGRTTISQNVLCQPVHALIAIGSWVELPDYMPDTAPQKPEASTPGMPIIGENTITTPEGDVLTFTHSEQFVATAYHNTDPGCTIWTATGTLCRVGAIAVDPKVIPYGTRMYIVTNDGQYIYGIATAEDCGSAIKGNRVDLYFDTTDECWEFGIRDCTIYFLG